jgi:hypothetical protein
MRISRKTGYRAGFPLAALMLAAVAVPAAGLARGAPATTGAPASPLPAPACLIHSLPSFVAQGEFATAATVGDVLEVECNPTLYGTGASVTITAAQLYSRCHELTWYVPDEPGGRGEGVRELAPDSGFVSSSGPSVHLHLDVDGNANVALIAGPHCMVGESLVTLDEDESPYETFTTAFQVLPATPTPQGLYATPSAQVEDATSSGVATIVQAEFTRAAEAKVRLASEQLYDRCQRGPHLIWVRENRELVIGPELVGEHAVELDNDGNGFALAIGSTSCAEGASLIEGDLEQSPFTTLTTEFTVLPPQPTAEPSFTIVKTQEISGGSGFGFTTAPLSANLGETVEYQITVTNTSTVPETFTAFTDAHCDSGTIAGGPGASAVGPGESTIYTCDHVLTSVGTYVNEATVTGNTVGGQPLTQTSNQVVVNVAAKPSRIEPSFTIEKRQRIGSASSYATAPLTAPVGATVEYEIVVKNTGNIPLKLSGFSDPNCDAGTIAGGPGEAEVAAGGYTTYTCTRLLSSVGTFLNVATVTATPPLETPMTLHSNTVEATTSRSSSPASGVGPSTEGPKQRVEAAKCQSPRPVLHGASGIHKGSFNVWVRSAGVARITFYLDSHRLRSFTHAQARHGRFKLKLNARKVSYGVHRVSFSVLMLDSNCAATAASRSFVRPRLVRFTG